MVSVSDFGGTSPLGTGLLLFRGTVPPINYGNKNFWLEQSSPHSFFCDKVIHQNIPVPARLHGPPARDQPSETPVCPPPARPPQLQHLFLHSGARRRSSSSTATSQPSSLECTLMWRTPSSSNSALPAKLSTILTEQILCKKTPLSTSSMSCLATLLSRMLEIQSMLTIFLYLELILKPCLILSDSTTTTISTLRQWMS